MAVGVEAAAGVSVGALGVTTVSGELAVATFTGAEADTPEQEAITAPSPASFAVNLPEVSTSPISPNTDQETFESATGKPRES